MKVFPTFFVSEMIACANTDLNAPARTAINMEIIPHISFEPSEGGLSIFIITGPEHTIITII